MRRQSGSFIGIFLILVGLALILRDYYYFDRYFFRSFGFFIIGVLGFLRSFSSTPRRGLYISSIFLFIGLYYILADAGFYYAERGLNTSAFTLIAGLSFYPLFLFGERNWRHLLYGNLIIAVGVVFLLFHLRYIPYYTFESIILDFWPVVLIVIGVAYLVQGLFSSKSRALQ